MTTKNSFDDSLNYEIYKYPFLTPRPLNMWYYRVLYGKVDQQGNVIHLSNEAKSKRLRVVQPSPAFSNQAGDILLIDFVADAFKNMQGTLVRTDTLGKSSRSGVIRIAIQKPNGGYVDVDTLYAPHAQSVFSIFSDIYLETSVKTRLVQNFDDYLRLFLEFTKEYAATNSLTKTSFIKSSLCTPLISGLTVQLGTNNHNSDEARMLWTKDPNFPLYVNTAAQNGLLVNKHAPWRLTANIASPRTVTRWIRHHIDSLEQRPPEEMLLSQVVPGCVNTDLTVDEFLNKPLLVEGAAYAFPETSRHFFESYYTKSCFNDINELKRNLVNNYNEFVTATPIVRITDHKRCPYGMKTDKVTQRVVTRSRIAMSTVEEKYSTDYWLKVYFRIRSYEEQVFFKEPKFRRILKSAQRIATGFGELDIPAAAMYINRSLRGFPETNPIVMTKPVMPNVKEETTQ